MMPAMDATTAYALLGVTPASTMEAVVASYRRAVRVAHPDHGGTTDHVRLVLEAYDVLKRAHVTTGPAVHKFCRATYYVDDDRYYVEVPQAFVDATTVKLHCDDVDEYGITLVLPRGTALPQTVVLRPRGRDVTVRVCDGRPGHDFRRTLRSVF